MRRGDVNEKEVELNRARAELQERLKLAGVLNTQEMLNGLDRYITAKIELAADQQS